MRKIIRFLFLYRAAKIKSRQFYDGMLGVSSYVDVALRESRRPELRQMRKDIERDIDAMKAIIEKSKFLTFFLKRTGRYSRFY